MKKKFFLVAIILGLLITACGGSTQTPSPSDSGASEEKVTLRVWSYQNPAWNQANQDLMDKYMAENPNIIIKYETFDYDTFIQTLQTSMTAGTEADVIEIFGTWACSYAEGGRLLPVPADIMTYDQAKEMYFDAPLAGYYCDGTLYGMPNEFNLENGGSLVNLDLFKGKGSGISSRMEYIRRFDQGCTNSY